MYFKCMFTLNQINEIGEASCQTNRDSFTLESKPKFWSELPANMSWFIAGLSIVLWLSIWCGLGATRLWDRDEPRNARCSVEMQQRGDWIVPVFNGELRTHKPILIYWVQMTAFSIFGQTDFAARAGSATMATIAVFATFWLGKELGSELGKKSRIESRWVGFWSASVLATSLMFVVAARAATPDAYLIGTCTVAVSTLVVYISGLKSKPRRLLWWIGFCSLGLSLLAKGPVGLVLPLLVVLLWSFQQQERIASNSWLAFLIGELRIGCRVLGQPKLPQGLLVALAIAAPWYCWVGIRTDGEWLYGFFVEHNVNRAISTMEGHRGGIWFYPAAILMGTFPWSLVVAPIAYWGYLNYRREPLSPMVQLGFIWATVYVVVFSIAKTKLPSYITPCYPGIALVIGGFLCDWAIGRIRFSRSMLILASCVFVVAGIAFSAGLQLLPSFTAIESIGAKAWLPLVLSGVGVVVFFTRNSNYSRFVPATLLVAAGLLFGVVFNLIGPHFDRNRGDLASVLAVAEAAGKSDKADKSQGKWFSFGTIEPSWIYYMDKNIKELRRSEVLADPNLIVDGLRDSGNRMLIHTEDEAAIREAIKGHDSIEIKVLATFKSFLKDDSFSIINGSEIK